MFFEKKNKINKKNNDDDNVLMYLWKEIQFLCSYLLRVIVLHYAKNVSNVVSDLLFQKLFMVAEEDTTETLWCLFWL